MSAGSKKARLAPSTQDTGPTTLHQTSSMSFQDMAAEAMGGSLEGDDIDARIDEALQCPCVGEEGGEWPGHSNLKTDRPSLY